MPYGLKRFQKSEALHFITFSCFHRLPLLTTLESKDTFLAELENTRARHQARIYAYVLMPEHVHLLINEPPSIVLAQLLKALKQTTSRRLRGDRMDDLALTPTHRDETAMNGAQLCWVSQLPRASMCPTTSFNNHSATHHYSAL